MDSTDKQGSQSGQNGSAKREGQHGQAASNTLQRPETETARTPPAEVEKAVVSSGRQGPVQANPAAEASGTTARAGNASTRESSPTLHNARPRSIDTLNDGSLDSTVDTDGKAQEARRDLPILRDHVISSNASLDDSVDTPDDGLAGIESRPGGNAPLIAPEPGYAVEFVGSREVPGRRQIDEQDDAAGDARALEPDNGARMAHLVKIAPKK